MFFHRNHKIIFAADAACRPVFDGGRFSRCWVWMEAFQCLGLAALDRSFVILAHLDLPCSAIDYP